MKDLWKLLQPQLNHQDTILEPRSSLTIHSGRVSDGDWREQVSKVCRSEYQLYNQLQFILPTNESLAPRLSRKLSDDQISFYLISCSPEFFTRERILHQLIVTGSCPAFLKKYR